MIWTTAGLERMDWVSWVLSPLWAASPGPPSPTSSPAGEL